MKTQTTILIVVGVCALIAIGVIIATSRCYDCGGKAPRACTEEAKICPDGSAVGRNGNNDCAFDPCPEAGFVGAPAGYVSEDLEECARIRYACQEGLEPFSDEMGCGCKASAPSGGKLQAFDCPAERTQACTKEYVPVCGWFDPARIQCIRYPCAATYGNSCTACADEKVISWTAGECPA